MPRDPAPPSYARSLIEALWPLAAAVVVGLVVQRVVAPLTGGFSALLLAIGINVILAVSLTVVNGFTGQFSMGHGGFMAVGGYVAAMIVYYGSLRLWGSADFAGGALSSPVARDDLAWLAKGDLLFLVALVAGGLAAAAAGYIVGLPSLRLKGDYLAIVTLGFGEIARVLLQGTGAQIARSKAEVVQATPLWKLPFLLGGAQGFNLLPTYATPFWIWAIAAFTLIGVYRLKVSSSGRAFLSIREDEVAAQAMGVNVTKHKVRAFVLSSFLAGVAGGLYAMYLGSISASELGFQKSFEVIIMVVLGGMGSISGATLAAIVLSILPEVLRSPPPVWPAGLALLVVMGVVQWFRGHWNRKSFAVVVGATVFIEVVRLFCLSRGIDLAQYRMVIYAVMLIVMMIVRPEGLFGVGEIWDMFGRRRAPGASADNAQVNPMNDAATPEDEG